MAEHARPPDASRELGPEPPAEVSRRGMLQLLGASAAFSGYLASFKSFNVTYGSFAAAIILLVWLWLTNVALLFGAEVNAEIDRKEEIFEGVSERKLNPPMGRCRK